MYAESKIAERLELASREFNITPERHSAAEVESFEKYLIASQKYTYNDHGIIDGTQNFTDFERAWILNEQILCACDAVYWMTRYGYLIDEEGTVLRFSFRTAQQLLFSIIADLESRDFGIEIMALKARQLGVTSLVQLLIGHRIFFGYGVNAVAGSADQQKTGIMASKMLLAYDMMPFWMRPSYTRRVESDRGMLVFGGTLSGVSFQHGAQMSGIARGTTPTCYHLSEVASFTDAKSQIEASLFKCVHPSPKIFGVLESTGEGDKGWWPDTWRKSRDTWPLSRMCPIFLPWFCESSLYPKPTWLRQRPIPRDWQPNRDTVQHTAKSELYVRSSPLLSKALGEDWRLPREKQWWWEVEHEQAKSGNEEPLFLQEYCGDDEEALQMSVTSVFGHKAIADIDNRRKKEYAAYGFSGQSIEDAHEPPTDDIDYDAERIPVRMSNSKGEVSRWELIPLRFRSPLRESDPDDAIGKLFVFHPPVPGVRYAMGIDTCAGMGLDSTCISVWGIGQKTQSDFQAAEFTSPYVSHVEAYAFGACIGAYYAKYMTPETTKYPMPYCAVEQVAAVGDTCQLQMIHLGYPLRCFHKMVRYDNTPAKIAKQRKGRLGKLGWFTWPWSRPILIDNFVHSAQNGWAEINSPWLIEEMKHFEVRITATGKEKMEHADDSHDDRIFAAAMPIFCSHDMDSLAERSKKRLPESAGALPPVDIAPYAGQTISSRELKESRTLTLTDILYSDTSNLRRHSY